MKTKHYITYFLTLFTAYCIYAQTTKIYDVPLIGNAFEVGHKNGPSTINKQNATITATNKNKTNVYFKVLDKGDITIKIVGKGSDKGSFKATFLGKDKKLNFDTKEQTFDLGKYTVKQAGYLHVELTGVKGDIAISTLQISGSAVANGIVYSNDPQYFYWARRGPSCHLAYEMPTKENVTYFYNEVLVPKGEDVRGSYYMANGFGEGYFGIQVNSETERRILFSVWSPFHTDDPNSIPEDQKITLLKKGNDVKTGEFGNEGSGGQSYLRYNWKADTTYKFLLKGQPDGKGNTDYTAWFLAPESTKWNLVASFKRPKTATYLKRFHSFLENFDPNQGYLTRKVNFNNQWVYDGQWKKVNAAKLTVDATYRANQRVDATGGTTSTGYFLKMGGFFNEIEQPNTSFQFNNTQNAPQIDFEQLP